MLLDSGNFSDNPTPEGDTKTRALLEGMRRLGYQVVNIGERDIRMGYDELHKQIADTEFEYVSANIVKQADETPVFKPHTIVEVERNDGAGKVRIGVVGAVRYNPMYLKAGPAGSNMVIAHPADRVRQSVLALKEQGVERIVLLAAMRKDDARAIVQEVSGIDYVMGSYGGMFTRDGEREGLTSIQYCGNRGQRLVENRVFLDEKKQDVTTVHFLTRQYPADQAMLDFVNSVAPEAESVAPAAGALTGGDPEGVRAAP